MGNSAFSPVGSTSSSSNLDVVSINTNTTAVKDKMYLLTANLTLTLPSSPTVNDRVGYCNLSGVLTCVLGRNGSKIMNLAEDLTIDKLNASQIATYSGATYGWILT